MLGTRRFHEQHFVKRPEPLSPVNDMESAVARARRILSQQPFISHVEIVRRWRGRSGRLEEEVMRTCRRSDPVDAPEEDHSIRAAIERAGRGVLCPGTEDSPGASAVPGLD